MQINLTAIIITAIICYTLYKMSKGEEEHKNEKPYNMDIMQGEDHKKLHELNRKMIEEQTKRRK